MSFFSELKRRNVIRMAGLYIVGAWLILQVSETLLPIFDTPNWVLKLLVYGLFIGFIPTLIMAWIFELTPNGLKRDEDVVPEQSIAPQTARRMERLIIALFAFAIIFFTFDKFILAPQREAKMLADTTKVVAEKTAAEIHAEKNKINPRSIAVLPFVNLSGDANNEYFSDGISEEILNVLAGTPELQVAARTSSFSFKGKNVEVPEIAKALKVRMVLEGSVRKQGNQVRITAQLIDASNGYHLWSKNFDRKLEDIFAIQDEIAKAIGDELKVKISGISEDGKQSSSTKNIEAYDYYLQGMALWHTRQEDKLWQALKLFEKAVSADPNFAQAYAGTALLYAILPSYSSKISWPDGLAKMRENALMALALDPTSADAYTALGNGAINDYQRETSIALLRRATVIRPSFATAHQWLGNTQLQFGDPENALKAMEIATKLDPGSQIIADNHAYVLLTLGKNKEAIERCNNLREFLSGNLICNVQIAMAEIYQGNYAKAEIYLAEWVNILGRYNAKSEPKDIVNALSGKSDKHALAVNLSNLPYSSSLIEDSNNALEDHFVLSLIVMLGENKLALDYMERMADNLGNTMDWAVMLPALNPIRCEPRFIDVVKKLKTHDPYFAKVCGGKK